MAPPKIDAPLVVNLRPTSRPAPAAPIQPLPLDSFVPSTDGQFHWNPRLNGKLAPPASPAWLEMASEVERYVRGGESGKDIVDFASGEIEGGVQAVKETVKGTATLIRHPVISATKLCDAVYATRVAVTDFPKHSEQMVKAAVEQKWNEFANASNRDRGRMFGSGLTQAGLTVAPFPKVTTVVSTGWSAAVAAMPKSALADRVLALPGKCYQIANELGRNTLKLRPSTRKRALRYVAESCSIPPERVYFSGNANTAYYPGKMDTLRIGPDLLPHPNAPVGTLGANSRIGLKGCLAHELKGHRRAAEAGKTHPNPILEEAQTSIRAARFGHDLTRVERITLLRDAVARLSKHGIRLRDVKAQLWINEP